MERKPWKWFESASAEENPKSPLYCAEFNFFNREDGEIFATAGINRAAVYRCPPDGGLDLLQVFVDSNSDEQYYVCKWSFDESNGHPLLLLAGKCGVMKAVDCVTRTIHSTYPGHGACINDIAVNPTRPWLVATASKDQAIRLWNLKSRTCIVVFQGDGGHRNEVLSVDWAPGGKDELVSAGMDSAIKVWSLEGHQDVITASDRYSPGDEAFPTKQVTFPSFSSRGVHWNYVDCVRWLGNFLLSKSVDNRIICWKRTESAVPKRPGSNPRRPPEGQISLIQILDLEDAMGVWWLRFAMDKRCTLLAVGTALGRVLVFDPHTHRSNAMTKLKPKRATGGQKDKQLLVRQTAVSYDGSIIVSCHEDGSLTRYDRAKMASAAAVPGALLSIDVSNGGNVAVQKQQQQQQQRQQRQQNRSALLSSRQEEQQDKMDASAGQREAEAEPQKQQRQTESDSDEVIELLDDDDDDEGEEENPAKTTPPNAGEGNNGNVTTMHSPLKLSPVERELAKEWLIQGRILPRQVQELLAQEEEEGSEKEDKMDEDDENSC